MTRASSLRRRSPFLLLIAVLLLAGITLFGSTPDAQASSHTRTVSNLGQRTGGTTIGVVPTSPKANSFTTGGATTDRFTLNSVVVDFSANATAATASIYSNSSGNTPDSRVGDTLTRQGSAATGEVTFNAPSSGIVLNGATTYWLVLETTAMGGAAPGLVTTTSDAEDSSSTSGWSIANVGYLLLGGNWTNLRGGGISLQFRVNAADQSVFHISNLSQTRASNGTIAYDNPLWMSFATGGASADRFVLEDVTIAVTAAADLDVELWSNSGTNPSSKLHDLAQEGSAATGNIAFAAAGVYLDGNTTYWVRVVEKTGAAPDPTVARTSSDNEDSGGSTGWSLGNNVVNRSGANYVSAWSESMALAVNTTALPQAETLLWSDTLTVDQSTVLVVTNRGCDTGGTVTLQDCSQAIGANSFAHGGVTYSITNVRPRTFVVLSAAAEFLLSISTRPCRWTSGPSAC